MFVVFHLELRTITDRQAFFPGNLGHGQFFTVKGKTCVDVTTIQKILLRKDHAGAVRGIYIHFFLILYSPAGGVYVAIDNSAKFVNNPGGGWVDIVQGVITFLSTIIKIQLLHCNNENENTDDIYEVFSFLLE
jgi:hypothetical protein